MSNPLGRASFGNTDTPANYICAASEVEKVTTSLLDSFTCMNNLTVARAGASANSVCPLYDQHSSASQCQCACCRQSHHACATSSSLN